MSEGQWERQGSSYGMSISWELKAQHKKYGQRYCSSDILGQMTATLVRKIAQHINLSNH